jgi:hypothetical protein
MVCLDLNNPNCDLEHLLRVFRKWLRKKTLQKYSDFPTPYYPPENKVFHFYEFRDWVWYHTNRHSYLTKERNLVETITHMSVLGWEIIRALEAGKLITRVRQGGGKNDFDFRFGD